MKVIKKVNVLSIAKLSAFLVGGIYFFVGLVIGLLVFILDIPVAKNFDILGLGSAILATLLVAVLMGVFSFLVGGILAWLFNIFSKYVGGIEFELEEASIRQSKASKKKKKKALLKDERSMFSKPTPQKDIDKLMKNSDLDSADEDERETFTY